MSMNTPNPLIPKGSLLQPGTQTRSKIGLVVFGVIAIHAVFFLGLLVQGCKREEAKKAEIPAPTALPTPTVDPYYTKYSELTNPTPAQSNQAPATPAASLPAASPATIATPEPATPTQIPAPMTPEGTDSGAREYVVAKGDSFFSIGKKLGVPMSAIAKANPGVDPARLKIGQKLKVPTSAAPTVAAPATAAMPEAASGFTSYTVKSGDTLTKIARRHGITVSALRSANGLKTDRIHVGKKLKVPATKAAAAPAVPAAETPGAIPAPSSVPTPSATTSAPPASAIPNQ